MDAALRDSIFKMRDCIGFFVFEGEYFWLVDWEAHFNLDQKKNFDAALSSSVRAMSKQEYREALHTFRNGIPTLTEDRFVEYRDSCPRRFTTNELRQEFFLEDSGQYSELSLAMEQGYSFGSDIPEHLMQLRWRLSTKLPKFYVNFDRKVFMDMWDTNRAHYSVVPDGWWGGKMDFEHLIPTSYRYWARSLNEDFWGATNFGQF